MTDLIIRESEITRASLLNRTMQNLREAWREVADWRGGLLSSAPSPNLPNKDTEALKAQMSDCLEARGGEVSARSSRCRWGNPCAGR